MKQIIMKRLVIAAVALLTVPTSLLAQKEKEKEKTKDDKKEVQHINIVRTGDLNVKTVIEIDGDKIKINGKDAKDEKDVHVNMNTTVGVNVYRYNDHTPRSYSFNLDDNNINYLFSEDNNRAMLGITTEGNDNGAEVESVTKESAAEKAGLKKGDVITKIGDKKIESTDDVTEAVRSHKPGDKVTITYLRDGKPQTATAELGKWKGINMNAVVVPKIRDLQLRGMNGQEWNMTPNPPMTFNGDVFVTMGRPRLGLSIQDTDDGIGVKVLDVDNESVASKAGIKKDDIILGINDMDIKNTDDVIRATRGNRDGSSYKFKIKRGGNVQTIEVKIPRKLKTADL